MLFGLTNTFTLYQKLINNILRDILDIYIIAYLNDILIFSKALEQHYKDIEKIFNCLTKVNLLLKPKKYTFYKKKVNFLSYIIIIKGIKADLEKIRAIMD